MSPQKKIEMMERSLRCHVMGCLGLIPGLGLPCSVVALALYFTVRHTARGQWNPAGKQLHLGAAFAVCGLLLSLLLGAAVLMALAFG